MAILGFANKTGDPAVAHWAVALEWLLSKELKEVRGLRLLPSANYALKQLNKKMGDPLDPAQARKLGELIEARRVVWGDYGQQGKQWLVTVRVLNAGTGKMLSKFKVASADWFEMRDLLVKRILKELNVRPTAAERRKLGRRWTSAPATLEWLCKAKQMELENKPETEKEKCMRRALEADPRCTEAYSFLAVNLCTEGKLEEAEAAARKAVALKPDYAGGHLTLGIILCYREKLGEAEDAFTTARHLDPEEVEAFEWLGNLYHRRNLTLLAIPNFNKAVALDPFSPAPHGRLGLLYAQQGNREKALLELREAERLALPEDIATEESLGEAYETLREMPLAVGHYEQVIALSKKVRVNPDRVKAFEEHLRDLKRELKARLTPVYIAATRPKDYTERALAEALAQKLNKAELLLVTNPFASTPEMNRWAQEVTAKATNDFHKALLLYDLLARRVNPSLLFNGAPTAKEVFDAWNTPGVSLWCKDLTCLYLALARASGLPAYYTLVYEEAGGEKKLHACAGVFFGEKVLLVDPAYFWFGAPHKKYALLDDFHAIALQLSQGDDLARAQIASKLFPDSAEIQFNLGGSLMDAGRKNEAHKAFLAMLQLEEPESWMSELARGFLAFQKNKLDESVSFLRKACEANPDDGMTRVYLGLAYQKQGRLREARTALREALRCPLNAVNAEAARQVIAEINEVIGNE